MFFDYNDLHSNSPLAALRECNLRPLNDTEKGYKLTKDLEKILTFSLVRGLT